MEHFLLDESLPCLFMRFSELEAPATQSPLSVIANFRFVGSLFLDIRKRSVCVDEDGNGRVLVQRLTEIVERALLI